MEQFESIRRDARDQEMSIRALADKYKVHRRTVRAALADAVPPARKPPKRTSPVLGPHEATIRGWLVEEVMTGAKAPLALRNGGEPAAWKLAADSDAPYGNAGPLESLSGR